MNRKLQKALKTPNDLKLSERGAWRGSCEGEAQKTAADVGQNHDRTRRVRARIAATVTRGTVHCSAWLGVAALRKNKKNFAMNLWAFLVGTGLK